ncbi:MAG: hypothetical protein COA57_03995 [Flavobacteriales bacterium]|nr:MAG: hypothetical protein COA57_03995 [Flavobacteriales bacterium]
MTTTQRDSISNPADGLVIYNTEDSALHFFNGVCWQAVYQENCDDCFFNMSLSSYSDTIDRTITDSVQIIINISQTAGNPQNIALSIANSLPAGMTYSFSNNPQFSSGTLTLTFHVTPFTPDGTFPIVIQGLCGPSVKNIVYSLTILPCYLVNIINSTTNYDLGIDFYIQYPSAPTSTPVCVVADVNPGVSVTSDTTGLPAFTTGVLPSGSAVAIVNNGMIIGMGGDGGTAYDPVNGTTGDGLDGGDAINLTENTTIVNSGYIFGGGGGGNAMAFALIYVPPSPAPTIGFLAGAGGGGGAGGGKGGALSSGVIGIVIYEDGFDGTGGLLGLGGDGGILNYPVTFTVSAVQFTVSPNAFGGDGGDYGYPGTQGIFNLTISVTLVITFPIIGTIPIPLVQNYPIPIPVSPPLSGNAGFAVKHNGFTTNIPDNIYITSFLKGEVGP